MGVFYASREDVMQALDVRAAGYTSSLIDRSIDSASRNVEGLCHRIFYPLTATKYFDYPNEQRAGAGRIWLDGNELISVSSFVSGGTVVPPSNYFLEPNGYGPPYRRIDLNLGTTATLNSGPITWQQAIAITGVWMGCALEEGSAGTLNGALTNSATTLTVANANVGVGRVLRIDTERMIVTDKTFISSGQTGTIAAQMNAQTLTVTDGTVFSRREEIMLDAERVLIVDIVGNTLTVKRAVSGSTLAAHTAATIYFGRQLTVQRGALGTTAAAHTSGTSIARHIIPSLIEQLTIQYALTRGMNEMSGYARTTGQGDSQGSAPQSASGLEAQVIARYGRKNRQRAV